jgi:6-phosphofructokinase 1
MNHLTRLRTVQSKINKSCILTSGGLCPGINVVVHNLTKKLKDNKCNPIGVQKGFYGLMHEEFVSLENTLQYANEPGSMLGMNRCHVNINKCQRVLQKHNFTQCYVIGGDGSLSGAHEISQNIPLSVVGIPKTIDNDIRDIDHTFGFHSAVDKTLEFVNDAYIEARCYNGISIVQTMGRNSGILAATTAASSDFVDLLIVNEFEKDADYYFNKVKQILKNQRHCVIVISENCDFQKYITLLEPFGKLKIYNTSYLVRNVTMNSYDRLYVKNIINKSVDLALKNYTDFFVGNFNNELVAMNMCSGISKKLGKDFYHLYADKL